MIEFHGRINLDLEKKDWCVYEGKCIEYLNITSGLCYHCCYKKPLDIPKMIEECIKNGGSRL